MSKFSEERAAARAARIEGPRLTSMSLSHDEITILGKVGLTEPFAGVAIDESEDLHHVLWAGEVQPDRGEGVVLLATLHNRQTLGRNALWSVGAFRPDDLAVYGSPEAYLRAAEHLVQPQGNSTLHRAINDLAILLG